VITLGKHFIIELYECPYGNLDNRDLISNLLIKAVDQSGATLIHPYFHQFSPQGVSGVVVIAESHFTIHTWPEYGYAAIDIFTCSDAMNINRAIEIITEGLEAGRSEVKSIDRGSIDFVIDRETTVTGSSGFSLS
jgi:S-adenosylmethionine decarboxylase